MTDEAKTGGLLQRPIAKPIHPNATPKQTKQ
jgi:hypothetical protein